MTTPHTAKLPAVVIWGLAGHKVQADQVSRVAVLGSGSLENVAEQLIDLFRFGYLGHWKPVSF